MGPIVPFAVITWAVLLDKIPSVLYNHEAFTGKYGLDQMIR
jgi:hypothetical protein